MAVDLKQQIERISSKMQLIVERQQAMSQKLASAREEIRTLKSTVMARDAEIEQLRRDNAYLHMVKSLTSDPRELRQAKVMITKLVREIDRCIRDLND